MTHCGLCERDAGLGYLCERHALALAGWLERLPALADELVDCLVPRRSGFGELVTARTAGPRSPINEDVLDLMQSNHVGEVVHSWRVDVQRERWPQHTPPPPDGLAADCRWLAMELEWIAAEYPAAGDLAREVRGLEGELRSLVGDPVPRRQQLGLCVAVTDDQGTVCGAVLSRLPGESLRCRKCRCVYGSEQDMLLLLHYQPKQTA
ncbi:hypothetical protein PV735_11270 [Streptomyces turgidiscabies]|uniref:Uncharacterized protein n=1 Tax=Streptomyces turgidiscabies (strain Car8) TaxID=698760 RepID=L7ERX8_STRT8|nr:hypothetical protein [Streptomyces turgidiscabies]ELP61787.1 hypothetical protein STRTUCAR8_06432 [Streptomyces turgidiscabies Car8]MDX3493264.1 hypothetical protein [Streptomyces turgidiscabies]GAQ70564.1 hypothetical protein T45_02300 [Streptomyces turgidiscabies]